MGREPRSRYQENLAPDRADNYMLGNSLLYSLERLPQPQSFSAPQWAHYFDQNSLPYRAADLKYGMGPFWWIEYAGDFDPIARSEQMRDELLKIVYGLWDYIKNRSPLAKQAENFKLMVKPVMGKRESRRLLGDYVMTETDIRQGTRYPDTVAFGGWPIDLHALNGIYDPAPPTVMTPVPPYGIPFRALYSSNISNLMMAGRNVSVSHVALGSTRIMGTCGTMGQAIGTAAALAAKYRVTPRDIARDRVAELQMRLQRDDAYLPGIIIKDPDDIAQLAQVSASSEQASSTEYLGPQNVLTGVLRPTSGKINAWVSDPGKPLPQWIQFDFIQQQTISSVQITFDTNLSIPRPDRQRDPLTVSDYEIQVRLGNQWISVATTKGNYQRLRRHTFPKIAVDAVRITVLKTNGNPSARIFGVRIYS